MFRFFTAISIALVLIVSGIGCSTASAATPDFKVTSSVDFNHSHDVTIKGMDVDDPPASPMTITSTLTGGSPHTHTIMLTKADYQSVKNGMAVSVVSSSDNNHTHKFDIKKP